MRISDWSSDVCSSDLLTEQIRSGLRQGQFVPIFQPIVDVTRRKVYGAETLTRWRQPDGGHRVQHVYARSESCRGGNRPHREVRRIGQTVSTHCCTTVNNAHRVRRTHLSKKKIQHKVQH